MRKPTRLTKIVLAAALGSMALTACGTENSTGKAPGKVSAAGATASAKPDPTRTVPSDALARHPDPEVRFLALETRLTNECAPGTMPELPALPPVDDISEPVEPEEQPTRGPEPVGPEEPPTKGPEPLPLPTDAPEPPSSEPTRTGPVEEVPLSSLGRCVGDAHAERIRKALDGASPDDYAELRKRLTALDYLPWSIHRMPDRGGRPQARIDFREQSISGDLAVDVTATVRGVTAEPFGAPVEPYADVTEVQRKPNRRSPAA
ncbi:hypothetical protein OG259_25290 [Streptomyces sp. NBC_00250]|uniref:hypothetical protein n=1 Tax=Streptomyces sp. NBC_00250 TaxID=2903641 RepID=UPI002E29FD68|nr:hypothetical protein [Streptomyces sp. NBC_00250]